MIYADNSTQIAFPILALDVWNHWTTYNKCFFKLLIAMDGFIGYFLVLQGIYVNHFLFKDLFYNRSSGSSINTQHILKGVV